MSIWHGVQTVSRLAGWAFLLVAALGVAGWATGGVPVHGTAGFKMMAVLGIVGGVVCLTIGQRNGPAQPSGPA
jgi:hypothetical protein